MKAALLLAPLAALSLLSSCELISCQEPQPTCDAPTAGTVLRQTCMAGLLVQLTNSQGGQTVQLDLDGTGRKTYQHVVSTYTELGPFAAPGTKIHFNLVSGGRKPDLQCLANDAPADLPTYTLCNVSATACDDQMPTPIK